MLKTILVVDDERGIADTLCAILQHAGYAAIAVCNAGDALEVLRTTPVDLLVSDVIMPAMNGMELALHARRYYPQTNIVLMSGNAATRDIVTDAESKGHRFDLLAKPVLPKDMLAHIEWTFTRTQRSRSAAAS
jgi:DNA-binding NtrC family response regulator